MKLGTVEPVEKLADETYLVRYTSTQTYFITATWPFLVEATTALNLVWSDGKYVVKSHVDEWTNYPSLQRGPAFLKRGWGSFTSAIFKIMIGASS